MNSISIGGSGQTYQSAPSLEFIEGYSFESGYLSPYFLPGKDATNKQQKSQIIEYGQRQNNNNENMEAGMYVFLTDMEIET